MQLLNIGHNEKRHTLKKYQAFKMNRAHTHTQCLKKGLYFKGGGGIVTGILNSFFLMTATYLFQPLQFHTIIFIIKKHNTVSKICTYFT